MKGATSLEVEGSGEEGVSIHAPVKGATAISCSYLKIYFVTYTTVKILDY